MGEVDTFSLHWDNNGSSSCQEYIKLGNPFERYYSDYRHRPIPIGACNGLVCLVDRPDSTVFIWNPCIRKFLMLPCDVLNDVCTGIKPRVKFAFGYEPRTNDYKLLRRMSRKVEIWSLANGSWKTLSDAAVPSYFYCVKDYCHEQHTCMHGRLHWAGQQEHNNFVVVFDLFNESFHKWMLPEALRKTHDLDFDVRMLGESLGLCESQPDNNGCFQLWVLKEYGVAESWAKLVTIRPETFPFKMLGLRNRGDVVLSYWRLKQVKLIDPETKKIKDFQIDRHSRYRFMRSFVESFALLDHPDAISY